MAESFPRALFPELRTGYLDALARLVKASVALDTVTADRFAETVDVMYTQLHHWAESGWQRRELVVLLREAAVLVKALEPDNKCRLETMYDILDDIIGNCSSKNVFRMPDEPSDDDAFWKRLKTESEEGVALFESRQRTRVSGGFIAAGD